MKQDVIVRMIEFRHSNCNNIQLNNRGGVKNSAIKIKEWPSTE